MPFLDNSPYALQAVFWTTVMGGMGWGTGLVLALRRRRMVTQPRERAEANR